MSKINDNESKSQSKSQNHYKSQSNSQYKSFYPRDNKKHKHHKCNEFFVIGGSRGLPGSANITTTLISNVVEQIDSSSNLVLDSSTNSINVIVKDIPIDKTNTNKYLPLGLGLNNSCLTTAFGPDGNLYAGGSFTVAGDVISNNIAMWDGISWSPLGNGLNNTCNTIVFDSSGNLYAGGSFTLAGETTTSYIAKWNGSTWSALGTGLGGGSGNQCNSIAFDSSGNLYAGGNFTFSVSGGFVVSNIAKWNGSVWSALGNGLGNTCFTIAFNSSNGNIYAGGAFTISGTTTLNYIGVWNGSSWSILGSGLNNICYSIVFGPDGNLYAGGSFTASGAASIKRIAMWNLTSLAWSSLGSGFDNTCYFIIWNNNTLYAGGDFIIATSLSGTKLVNRIAKWNGFNWLPIDSNINSGFSSTCRSITFDSTNNLYAGGAFIQADTTIVNRITTYNNNYVNLLVGSQLVDIVSGFDTKSILISNNQGYSLTYIN